MGYRPGVPWDLFMKYAADYFKPGMRVLEVGPGKLHKSLPKQFLDDRGCDYYFADRKNCGDDQLGYVEMPNDYCLLTNTEWNAVVCYEMLHNVRHPWKLVPVLAKALRPGGILVIVDVLNYGEFNRWPVDFGRIFPDGMSALFEQSGAVVDLCRIGSSDDLNIKPRGVYDLSVTMHMITIGHKPI